MRLTYQTAAAADGLPRFVGDDGQVIDFPLGFRALRKTLRLTAAQLGEIAGVSARTVYGWEYGKMPGAAAMVRLHRHLNSLN